MGDKYGTDLEVCGMDSNYMDDVRRETHNVHHTKTKTRRRQRLGMQKYGIFLIKRAMQADFWRLALWVAFLKGMY